MATAPPPGAQRQAKEARQYFKIIVDGVEAVIRPADFGPRDEVIVRAATRRPDPEGWGFELSLQGLLAQLGSASTIGTDTLATLFWFGRRKVDPNITLRSVIDTWPPMNEVQDRVDLVQVDPDSDDEDDLTPEG